MNGNKPDRKSCRGEAFARGFALFVGSLVFLNLIVCAFDRSFEPNIWWIDLRFLPHAAARTLIILCAPFLISYGLAPRCSPWRKWVIIGSCTALSIVILENIAAFTVLLARGDVTSRFPLPFSSLLLIGLATIVWFAVRSRHQFQPPAPAFKVCLVALTLTVLFPLLQMFCFGKTDYRRPADVAVVLGARVYADGRPSDALADRVRTAVQLYKRGLVKKLLVSGGPGDGAVHETEGMKRMAIQLGVREQDIILDPNGLNTRATVKNSKDLLGEMHASRVLVVSHFYHLPRIKLAYQQDGLEVFTVPARESYLLRQLPFNMAREVAAFWVYYLQPLRTALV